MNQILGQRAFFEGVDMMQVGMVFDGGFAVFSGKKIDLGIRITEPQITDHRGSQ
jgi:hypothetical protein